MSILGSDIESQKTLDEVVNRVVDGLHSAIDRLNGARIVLTDGGLTLTVPPRKTEVTQ